MRVYFFVWNQYFVYWCISPSICVALLPSNLSMRTRTRTQTQNRPIIVRQWAPTTEGYTSRNHLSCFNKHDNLGFEITRKENKLHSTPDFFFSIIFIFRTRHPYRCLCVLCVRGNKESVILLFLFSSSHNERPHTQSVRVHAYSWKNEIVTSFFHFFLSNNVTNCLVNGWRKLKIW